MTRINDIVGRKMPPLPGLGLGGGPLGNHGSAVSDEDALATIRHAWDRGIRSFDTAPHYGLGLSERRYREGLAGRPRDDFVLSTKVGRLIVPNEQPTVQDSDGFVVPGDRRRQWDFSADGVRASLEQSLDRLGLDRVDVLFAHDPDQFREGAARQGLESLRVLKDEGLVSAIGIGTNSSDGLAELIHEGLVDVIMLANRYSLLDHDALTTVLAPAEANGVSVISVGVFGTGLLATAEPQPHATYFYTPPTAEILDRLSRIRAICARYDTDVPTAALAFPRMHPAVIGVTIGMRSRAEVNQNVDRFTTAVPAELWTDLAEAGLIPAAAVSGLA